MNGDPHLFYDQQSESVIPTLDEQASGPTTARIEALSDGVFAIAMTLLIFNFQFPHGLHTQNEFMQSLKDLTPSMITYGMSFLALGRLWVGHHSQFHWIQHSNRILLWINIFFLAVVSLIPFTATILGEYHRLMPAIIIYAANMFLASVLLYVHWSYATTRTELLVPNIRPGLIEAVRERILNSMVLIALALLIAFFEPFSSVITFLIAQVLAILPSRVDKILHEEVIKGADTPAQH